MLLTLKKNYRQMTGQDVGLEMLDKSIARKVVYVILSDNTIA